MSVSFRTRLAENINLQASSSFTIYGLSEKGATVSELAYLQGRGIMRMTSLNLSVDMDLATLLKGKGSNPQQTTGGRPPDTGAEGSQGQAGNSNLPLGNKNLDEYGYVRFDVPWSLRMGYNFSYSKPTFKTNISQQLTLSGDVRLTPKTAINYSTGFDFAQNEITMTRVGISRDLHCWEMNFSWIPTGYMRSWNFTIRAKSGVLQDLKYERRKDYHENY
ncbi:MAG: hypothetical protein IH593_06875 [Bacteroidales bacterium]|nr:hypothetical protein [Bacteroidales bacterium]